MSPTTLTRLYAARDEVAARIGNCGAKTAHPIESGAVGRFAAAVAADLPRDTEPAASYPVVAPPTYLCALRPDNPMTEVPFGISNINAGNVFELAEPVQVGDVLTSEMRIVGVRATIGRTGALLLVTRETSYVNQHGRQIAVMRTITLRREPAPPDITTVKGTGANHAGAARPGGDVFDASSAAAGDALPGMTRHSSLRQSVMFAGAVGDFNEIHYDPGAAARADLPGVIVHGQLKAAWLADALVRWAEPKATLTRLEVSYRGADLVGDDYAISGYAQNPGTLPSGDVTEAHICGSGPTGKATTTAVATLAVL